MWLSQDTGFMTCPGSNGRLLGRFTNLSFPDLHKQADMLDIFYDRPCANQSLGFIIYANQATMSVHTKQQTPTHSAPATSSAEFRSQSCQNVHQWQLHQSVPCACGFLRWSSNARLTNQTLDELSGSCVLTAWPGLAGVSGLWAR